MAPFRNTADLSGPELTSDENVFHAQTSRCVNLPPPQSVQVVIREMCVCQHLWWSGHASVPTLYQSSILFQQVSRYLRTLPELTCMCYKNMAPPTDMVWSMENKWPQTVVKLKFYIQQELMKFADCVTTYNLKHIIKLASKNAQKLVYVTDINPFIQECYFK